MHRWARRHRRVIAARLRAASQYNIPKTFFLLLGLSPWLLFASCDRTGSRGGLGGGAGQALSQSQDQGTPGQNLAVAADQSSSQGQGVTCSPVRPDLAAWYTGDSDGTDLVHANNGTLSPGVSIVPGRVGNAFQFDGSTGDVSIPTSGAIDFGAGQDFTLEAWIAVAASTDHPPYRSIVYKHDRGRTVGFSFFIYEDQAGPQLGLQLADGATAVSDGYDNYFQPTPGLLDGQFHHVAVSIAHSAGGGMVTFYVDGSVSGQGQPFQNLRGSLQNDSPLLIGALARFPGRIDEVGIYQRALTAGELRDIAAAGVAGKCKPTALIAGDQAVTGLQDTPIDITLRGASASGASLAFHVVTPPARGTLSAITVLSPNAARVQYTPGQGFTGSDNFTFQVTDGVATSTPAPVGITVQSGAQRCFSPPSSPVAWYPGDVDGKDRAHGHDGVLLDGATVAAGHVAGALQFNGQDGGAQISNNGDIDFGASEDFTLETWVQVHASVASREYLSLFYKQDGTGRGYSFFLDPLGRVGLQLASSRNDGEHDEYYSSLPSPSVSSARDGQYHHVAVTVDHVAGVRFYVDGVPAESAPQGLQASRNVANTAALFLGRNGRNTDSSLAGQLDEASVYDRVLSPADISGIYRAGTTGKCKATIASIAGPDPVTAGATYTYTATVSGAADTGVAWSVSGGSIDQNGRWTVPLTPGTYTVTATATTDGTVASSRQVTVVAAPTIDSFVADVTSVILGGSTTLRWATTGAVSTSISPVIGPVAPASSGSAPTGTLTVNTIYTLTATNAAGTRVMAQAPVSIDTVSVSAISPAGPTRTVGTSTTFAATVSGAVNTSLTWSASCGTINGASGAWIAPASPGTCTITATSNADPSKSSSTTVTVVAVPVVNTFMADATNVPYGGSTRLRWATTGADSVIILPAIGSVSPVTSGSVSTGVLTSTTTYTLTATNAAGMRVTAQVTVAVSPVTISPISPANPTLTAGTSTTFTATVSGAVDTSVTWSASCGTINGASGAWTAPAMPGSCTITATANADHTTSSLTTVTVVAALPNIATQPVNQTVAVGQTATFSVSATGSGTLSYQWQRSNDGGSSWANLSGATSSSYTTAATVTGDNNARFRVIVINTVGGTSDSATSGSATLSVLSCTLTSSASSLACGGTATLQWTTVNATSGSISGIGSVSVPSGSRTVGPLTTATTYTMTVGAAGATSTCTAPVINVQTPQVSLPLAYTAVAPGQTMSFTATATGTVGSTIYWSTTGGTIPSTSANGASVSWAAPSTPGSRTVTATTRLSDGTCQASASTTVTVTGFLNKGTDGKLYVDGAKYNVATANLLDLLHWYVQGNRARAYNKLADAKSNGIAAVRFFAGGLYRESAVNYPTVLTWRDSRASFFAAFDQLLQDATALDIRIIPSLVTGLTNLYEQVSGCTHVFSYPYLTGTQNYTDMRNYALDIVGRYQAHPMVLFWELGNELNLFAKERSPSTLCVTRQQLRTYISIMATNIKALDRNHLFASGAIQEDDAWPLGDVTGTFNDLGDFFRHYQDIPGVDIAAVHLYQDRRYANPSGTPQNIGATLKYFQDLALSFSAKEALWIGEFGVPPGTPWSTGGFSNNNYHEVPISILLARSYLDIQLASVWDWESRDLNGDPNPNHPELVQFSVDPGEDDDLIGALREIPFRMGNSAVDASHTFTPLAADFNGDRRTDLGVGSNRGLWAVSLTGATAGIPAGWHHEFADDRLDPGCAPAQRFTGDWDGNGRADIGVKCTDGRWYVAFSNGTSGFGFGGGGGGAQEQWHNSFGNDYADPGCAPSQPVVGDWNKDGRSDIGIKCKDGRWYVAVSNGSTGFGIYNGGQIQGLWHDSFGNDDADSGCAPSLPIVGDWNADGRSDIGVKCRDGRWYVAASNGSTGFGIYNGGALQALWNTSFANDTLDPGCAPSQPVIGDWNGDSRTDMGVRCRDGRWFITYNSGSAFGSPAAWLQ